MNHVFILGAGASKAAADAPLGTDLIWGPGAFAVEKSRHRRFVQLCLEIWPELHPLCEQLDWPALFTPYGTVSAIARKTHKKYCVDELLEFLLKNRRADDVEFVREAIYRHIAGAIQPQTEAPMYQFFIRHLHELGTRASVSLISFNYDHLLHEDFKLPFYFDYGIEFDHVSSGRDYRPDKGVLLLKPNGSFDWLDCPKCGKLSLVFHQCWANGYLQQCPLCQYRRAQRCITLPHEDNACRYSHLWDRVAVVLRQADVVTVIGYSFPDYDVRMRATFRENVKPSATIAVVDWAETGSRRDLAAQKKEWYRRHLLGRDNARVCVRLYGFEGYLEQLGYREEKGDAEESLIRTLTRESE